MERCSWCGQDPLYIDYHDTEWGVPCRDGRALFEQLSLEGFQAGLSWITILRKRDGFRAGFAGFDPVRIAAFDAADVDRLLSDAGIVRHRGKIEATITNARAWMDLGGADAFSDFIWAFVDHRPRTETRHVLSDVPAQTDLSVAMSKALKKRGFRFCGPTTVYAFMQAAGLVNDHLISCPRQREVATL